MRPRPVLPALLLLALGAALTGGGAPARAESELSGELGVEGRAFLHEGAAPGTRQFTGSAWGEIELYGRRGPLRLTVTPFYRYDTADPERTHFDLREGYLLAVFPRAELAVGWRKVFWGVTESVHLVDVINQTDLVESPDGEDKLGQPMVQLTVPGAAYTLDLFLLPWFRERTFPGPEGRLSGPVPVADDFTLYESGHRRRHPDWAARYKHYLGPLEAAVSHFSGTSREPVLIPGATCLALGCPPGVLVPSYPLIEQTGLEAQLVLGEWLWKLEAIRRAGQAPDPFYASAAGFEYTFVGVAGTVMDLGVLAEYLRDTRPGGTTPFDHDVTAGLRLTVNDLQSTELLVAVIRDTDTTAWLAYAEGSRRVGDRFRLELEARLFGHVPPSDPLYGVRRDDLLQLALAYHF